MSIGNLQMGGGGKTPFAIKLLELMVEKNVDFIYSTRAYKSKIENKGLILSLSENVQTDLKADEIGDEPAMILDTIKKGTFLFGKKRKQLLQKFSLEFIKQKSFEVLVLEDAFQHLKIERDSDVLLVDVTCPVEKFRIFPLGNLRESVLQLWKADYIILNKVNQVSSSQLVAWRNFIDVHKKKSTSIAEIEYVSQSIISLDSKSKLPLKDYKNQKVILCSAIANPNSFKVLVEKLGFTILQVHELPDHSSFSPTKMNKILDYATQNEALVLCTEKDAVKLKQNLNSDRIYYVKLELKLSSLGDGPWDWLLNFIQK